MSGHTHSFVPALALTVLLGPLVFGQSGGGSDLCAETLKVWPPLNLSPPGIVL